MVQQRANKRLRTGAWTLVACLAMTGLTLYLKMRPCCTPGPQPKQPLIDWLVDNGGMVRVHCLPSQLGTSYEAGSCMQCCTQAGVAIKAVSAGSLMGTVATQDFKEGDVIMSVPDNLAVGLLVHRAHLRRESQPCWRMSFPATVLSFNSIWLRAHGMFRHAVLRGRTDLTH